MFEFLSDLPLLITGPAIVGSLCLFSVVGLAVVRRCVLPRLRIQVADSEFTGAMLQSIMVFYGLAVALMAVNVSQTYTDVSKIVSGEASSLNALYRDVSSYPEPIRLDLQNELREYTDQVIHQAWPLQRRGEVPTAGVGHMNRFQAVLDKFEPTTEGQKLLHGETLRAFNLLIQARRLRLGAVSTGLPAVMWGVIIAGAFIGLVIFMIFALDRPFRGDLGLGPESYQLIYDQLMKGNP